MPAFDVDLEQWLNGVGFHPANTELKQIGHQAARNFVAQLGMSMHQLLPPGRDKSIVFTLLEDVLMRANRALALGDGPQHDSEDLRRVAAAQDCAPQDPRIEAYKAEQRGEEAGAPLAEAQEYDEFKASTLVTTVQDGSPIQVELHAEPYKHIQLGVMCTDQEQVVSAVREATPDVPFEGFWFTLDSREAVNQLLQAIDQSARHAFPA